MYGQLAEFMVEESFIVFKNSSRGAVGTVALHIGKLLNLKDFLHPVVLTNVSLQENVDI